MNKLMDWGLSMYGGYYATTVIDEKLIGLHSEKYSELKEELAKYGLKPEKNKRRDNL